MGWPQLWHQFIMTLTQQPVAVVLSVWIGLALVLVMALEGLLLNLFPACVFQRYLEKMPQRKRKPAAPAPAAKPLPVPVSAPAPPIVLAPVPASVLVELPAAEPPVAAAAEPPAMVAAEMPPKSRFAKSRNSKKPAPGPKTVRATSWRRASPPRERLSRGTPRLLAPKN